MAGSQMPVGIDRSRHQNLVGRGASVLGGVAAGMKSLAVTLFGVDERIWRANPRERLDVASARA